MKITFIKPGASIGLAYFAGDAAEFEDKQAAELIERGIAKKYAEKETTEKIEAEGAAKATPKAKKAK